MLRRVRLRGGAEVAGGDEGMLSAAAGFSPNGDDARLRRQVSMLDEAADDMMDRFVLYTPIVPDGRQVTTPADAPYSILDAKAMGAVRAQFHVAAGGFYGAAAR